MNTTRDYLRKAMQDGGNLKASEFAALIGWTQAALSRYLSAERVMDRRACLQLAAFMKLTLKEAVELQVLADIEQNGQLPLATKDFFQRAALSIGYIVIAGLCVLSPENAWASTKSLVSGISLLALFGNASKLLIILYIMLQRVMVQVRRLLLSIPEPYGAI